MTLPSLFSLGGRRALVTGAAQGLGRAAATTLGEAGAVLLLNDFDEARLNATAEELRRLGCEVHVGAFDVTDEQAVQAGVARLEAAGGPVDILVNNVGIHRRAPLATMTLRDWQAVMDANLTSAFLMGRAVAPGMIARRRGKIINVCSLNSELSRPTIANYAAAKGGLKMLTRAMAVEWGPHNVQANGLGPGYIRTELTDALAANPDFDRWICARTPAGRWGRPADLAGATLFLASGASDFVNGQVLYVDGGLLAAL